MIINWLGRWTEDEGYGLVTRNLFKAFLRQGSRFKPYPFTLEQWENWGEEEFYVLGASRANPTLFIGSPFWVEFDRFNGKVLAYTMYETTGLPSDWPPKFNKHLTAVLVPCEQNAKSFAAMGVKVPIFVVPEGVDFNLYSISPVLPPIDKDPYVFMCLGDRGNRKGWHLAWQAFYEAFGKQKDVRLIIKSREFNLEMFSEFGGDWRVKFWRSDVPLCEMPEVYRMADVFVFPTFGEGYGLPPREATACGVPAIVTAWGGTEDVVHWGIPLSYDLVPSTMEGGGLWARPNVGELAEKMRWCYDHREDARAVALRGAQWLRENASWDVAASKLASVFEEVFSL
ncbi:MAG: glycosyltransferase family 4 protein [Candidatus Methanomethylicaceae archaeon]